MIRFRQFITRLFILCALLVGIASCSMMEEDYSQCAEPGLYVNFTYDYNTQRADMFKDHVGAVTLYIYDELGHKVAERTVSNSATEQPLSQYGYRMHFDESELPAGKYRLQAIGMQKDWDEALATPGAKYRRTPVADTTSLVIKLDREEAVLPGTEQHAVSNVAPLDTLWHTLKVMSDAPRNSLAQGYIGMTDVESTFTPKKTTAPYTIYPIADQLVTVEQGMVTYATVSLIRDTKHLNISMRHLDNPQLMDAADYDVYIVDNNGALASNNMLLSDLTHTDSLRYTPYAAWTTEFTKDGVTVLDPAHMDITTDDPDMQRAAHYDLMFNRIMYHKNVGENAQLFIVNRDSGKMVAHLNLPYILAEARTAYEIYNYSPQEYLDREYEYRLDFLLKGDTWAFVTVSIDVLSWSKRIQNVDL